MDTQKETKSIRCASCGAEILVDATMSDEVIALDIWLCNKCDPPVEADEISDET